MLLLPKSDWLTWLTNQNQENIHIRMYAQLA